MKRKLTQKNHGFTIIEIMIVLAIAGLILAIIFLAVPSLQRNARNNSRKNDATHLAGLVSEYSGNNAGSLPKTVCAAGSTSGCLDLTNENFAIMTKPTNAASGIYCASGCSGVAATNTYPNNDTTLYVVEGFTCNPSSQGTLIAGSSSSFSITYELETSGGTTANCIPGS